MDHGRRQQIHAWIVRFADGDRAAFQPLFDALWPTVLAVATRGLGSQADGEDAAQHALLKVFARVADFDRSRDGLGWVLAIVAFEVLTLRRQRRRRREQGDGAIAALRQAGGSPEDEMIVAELRRAVLDIVGELSQHDQQALARALAGEKPPRGETARKQRFRAIERLRAAWTRAHG